MSKWILNWSFVVAAVLGIPALTALIPCSSFAADAYSYLTLQTKPYDEMLAEVKIRIKKTELPDVDREQASVILVDAIELIMSRPDTDGVVAQLMQLLRTSLKNFDIYESSLTEFSENMISSTKSKKMKATRKATAIIALTNFLSEFKPESKTNGKIKSIFKNIQGANIEISDDVASEMRLNAMMKKPVSPSEIAKTILEENEKKK